MYVISFEPFNNYLKEEQLSLVFNFTDEETDSKDLPQNYARSCNLTYGNNIPWSHNQFLSLTTQFIIYYLRMGTSKMCYPSQ